jgi:hypothetical protein
MDDARVWAQEQFGHAELGDLRRTRRLVQVAAEVIERPSGIVSRVCATSASREGAFRLLENPQVRAGDVLDAVFAKTAADCRGKGTVIVPVDATSLSLEDDGSKGLGPIAHGRARSRGIHAVTALAVTNDGTTIGIAGQALYVRATVETPGRSARESRYWLDVLESVERLLAAPDVRPWLVMDRAFDSNDVLALAAKLGSLITIRARANRKLETGASLWTTVARAPIRARKEIEVPAGTSPVEKRRHVDGKICWTYGPPRSARVARVVIRAAQVTPCWPLQNGKRPPLMSINAVLVRETGRSKDDRIEWLLLTTHPIRSRADVIEVVRTYTLRWRIEDFHRAWKDGLCRVEDTQLRSRDAIYKWSTILAAVATRAMRLTHLARETPDVLASTEFSAYELEAIVVHRKPKGFAKSDIPKMTLAQAIRWIADTAGYTGPWKGPPGVTIVGRGLYAIELIARAFEERDGAKK